MTQDELISKLKQEIIRVKYQRNNYESMWLKAIREIEELKQLYNLPSYVNVSKEVAKMVEKQIAHENSNA